MVTTQRVPDETDKRIVKMCADGKTSKEIGYQLNLKSKSISYRIEAMKKYYNCNSIAHLVAKFYDLDTGHD